MEDTRALQALVQTGIFTMDEARERLLLPPRPMYGRQQCDICDNEAYDYHFKYGRGEIAVCTKCQDDLTTPALPQPKPTRWQRFRLWIIRHYFADKFVDRAIRF